MGPFELRRRPQPRPATSEIEEVRAPKRETQGTVPQQESIPLPTVVRGWQYALANTLERSLNLEFNSIQVDTVLSQPLAPEDEESFVGALSLPEGTVLSVSIPNESLHISAHRVPNHASWTLEVQGHEESTLSRADTQALIRVLHTALR
jgi:hypothetical protein